MDKRLFYVLRSLLIFKLKIVRKMFTFFYPLQVLRFMFLPTPQHLAGSVNKHIAPVPVHRCELVQ